MHKITHFIGIDVSKLTLDFALFVDGKVIAHWQIENTNKAIKKLLRMLVKQYGITTSNTLFILEYTGVYNEYVVTTLSLKGYFMCLESGVQVKRSLGLTRGKNDKVDSKRLAEYGFYHKQKLKFFTPNTKAIKQLAALISYRDRLLKTKKQHQTASKEQTKFLGKDIMGFVTKDTKALIKHIKSLIKNVEQKIKQIIDSDPELKRLYTLVVSVKGVGLVTAIRIIVATNGFTKITEAKKFACYSGVVPFEHSSGTSIRGKDRVSNMANKKIKRDLNMCARSAVQYDPELKEYYNRKVAEGKNKMSVLNAVRNKLVHRVFACVRDNRQFTPKYQNKAA